MTKPFHDSGELRRIGEITTPWPCFLVASTLSVLQKKRSLIHLMMDGIQESCRLFAEEKDSMPLEIAERYSLKPEDAKAWYDNVTITATSAIPLSAIETVVSALKEAKVLPADYTLIPTGDRTPNLCLLPRSLLPHHGNGSDQREGGRCT